MDRLRDLAGQLWIGIMAVGDLDLDRHRWDDGDLPFVPNDPRPSRDARSIVAHDREDRGRVDVHSSHDEHVVAAPQNAHAKSGPLASARGSLDAHYFSSSYGHHRHGLARESRVD